MYSQQQSSSDEQPQRLHPVAVELHGLDANVTLHQLRQLCSQAGPCLQVLAALEGGEAGSGLALAVFASEPAAAQACDLLNNYPLGSAFLRVQRAQSLPGQLIDLLWSVVEVRTRAGKPPRRRSRCRGSCRRAAAAPLAASASGGAAAGSAAGAAPGAALRRPCSTMPRCPNPVSGVAAPARPPA